MGEQRRTGPVPIHTLLPPPSNTAGRFGSAITAVGDDKVLIGAPGMRKAFVFQVDTGALLTVYINTTDGSFVGTLVSPNPQPGDMFGAAIAVFGNQVLIGAPGADTGRGAVYLFEHPVPVAFSQAVSTGEDTPRAVTLLATDDDDVIAYAIVSPPSNGTLSGTPPSVVYTPKANFHGSDKFAFKATDSSGFDSNVATVSITVAALNDAPVALGQSVTMPANTSLKITLQATDVDGDPLSFLLLSQPGSGVLSGTPPNLTYTPKAGFIGADSFTFRASDGKALSNVGTVKLSVLPGLTIDDVTSKEANSGTTTFTFTVRLSIPSPQTVSVTFATADSTARAGSDYVATTGTLTFAPGETAKGIKVVVIGDQLFEADEAFLVVLSTPVNAIVVDGTGVGTIVNDDPVLGVTTLVPQTATIAVDERLALDLTWTHPENWRNLRSIDLRIVDGRGVVLWARFHEGRDTLSLVHGADDRSGHGSANGRVPRLETSAATLHVAVSGIVNSGTESVTLRFEVSFKSAAAGRVYRVEAAAIDDAGNQQGFEQVGTLEVRRASRP
jgi:hypothetical protein